MADAYVIETAGETAGIVVLEKGGVRFYASEPAFYSLDGKSFLNVNAVHKAVSLLRATRSPSVRNAALKPAA